jgi:predicted MFS family arabinose efflux permease
MHAAVGADAMARGRNTRLATRASFLVAGLGVAAWAPLVPYAKARLGVDDATLGLLLLCLGAGSVIFMPLAGILVGRSGCRRVIVAGGAVLCLVLPALAVAASVPLMGLALFAFGAAVGAIDVAMNAQAVIVEKAAARPLMSGFHALYSVGGIAGAAGVSAVLGLGLAPLAAVAGVSIVLALLLAGSRPHLLPYAEHGGGAAPLFVLPRGRVALIGLLCFVVFLAEGAMLDWGALYLTASHGFAPADAGIGYAAFAVAMTLGRLFGDRVVHALGGPKVLLAGGACAALGFVATILVPAGPAALAGFVLVGLGCSNIVPVLFTAAGRQTAMPSSHAVAAITTLGYAGILAGPAMIGLIAEATSLPAAFGLLAALLALVAASARIAR